MELKGLDKVQEKSQKTEIAVINLDKTKQEVATRYQDPVVLMPLVQKIDLGVPNTIVVFGSDTANEISKVSDKLLHSMETLNVEDSGAMLMQLNKIMDKFDVKDFEKKDGLLTKVFNKGRNTVDKLMGKYHTMGDEVDKVYVLLKGYENEIYDANNDLQEMFNSNLSYYEELEKYIQAGKLAVNEMITNIIPDLESNANITQSKADLAMLGDVRQMKDMLEQRIYDLELAQNVAFQSLSTIKMMQKGNYDLIRKINSAFIITIPVFKDCLTSAIYLKRQEIQSKATKALEEKTKEMLLRRAENTAEQTKAIAQMASGSFIDIATLEQTWETITNGVKETKQIQIEANKEREAGRLKLARMKEESISRLIGTQNIEPQAIEENGRGIKAWI